MASRTSRRSVVRGRPPGYTGMSGSTKAHCSSVTSLGYLWLRIPTTYENRPLMGQSLSRPPPVRLLPPLVSGGVVSGPLVPAVGGAQRPFRDVDSQTTHHSTTHHSPASHFDPLPSATGEAGEQEAAADEQVRAHRQPRPPEPQVAARPDAERAQIDVISGQGVGQRDADQEEA